MKRDENKSRRHEFASRLEDWLRAEGEKGKKYRQLVEKNTIGVRELGMEGRNTPESADNLDIENGGIE